MHVARYYAASRDHRDPWTAGLQGTTLHDRDNHVRLNAPSTIMRAHPLALDELYERLKAHDPGLQAVLQSRWNDLKASRQVPHASIAPVSATCSASTALELARRPSLALPIETRGAGIRSTHLLGPWDITAPELKPGRIISDHDTWVRQFDWASTDLGPMTSWSSALRQAVNYLLADPRAALLCWGEQRTCICMYHLAGVRINSDHGQTTQNTLAILHIIILQPWGCQWQISGPSQYLNMSLLQDPC